MTHDAALLSCPVAQMFWIASRGLSSGAHSRDPLARNDNGQEAAILSPCSAAVIANPSYPLAATSSQIRR